MKGEAEQKQISNEIITIPRERGGEIEGEKKKEKEQGCHNREEQSCRVNGKGEVGGGREGYLDNRAGDRSTMTAVFSIRHYLIDRVAGLIVRGGYFRAAFVWGSAPVPQPSSTPDSPNPTPFPLMSQQRPCYLVQS